jgi:adenosylcobyric acid synthase
VRYGAGGGHVFGICGGLQMLGASLQDPQRLEGGTPGPVQGLGLLPLETLFAGDKALRQRRSLALWPAGATALELDGFELHRGRSQLQESPAPHDCRPIAAAADLGWWQPFGDQGGLVAGTYLHGVFDSGAWRRRWLNGLRQRKGLPPCQKRCPSTASNGRPCSIASPMPLRPM